MDLNRPIATFGEKSLLFLAADLPLRLSLFFLSSGSLPVTSGDKAFL